MAQCQARKKTCSGCGIRFTKEHRDLWECPECGTSRRCRKGAVTGFNVCRSHGAGSKNKPSGRKAKDGLRASNLPVRLLSTYEAVAKDDRLMELRRDIELAEVRINDLLTRVSTNESGDAWKKFSAAHKQLIKAYKIGDEDTIRAVMHDLGTIIDEGKSDYKAWSEIFNIVDKRRRLVETERKFLMESQTMISADKLLNIMIATVRIINSVVQSERQRRLIQTQLNSLVIDYDPAKKRWGNGVMERVKGGADYEEIVKARMIEAGVEVDG